MKGVLPLVRGRISSRTPGGRSVDWAATGRSGGVSRGDFSQANLALHVGDDPGDVRTNANLLRVDMGADTLIMMNAEHGARIRQVEPPSTESHETIVIAEPGDGLLTTQEGIALAALGADCATFVVTDGRVLGVGHCGWQGVAVDLPGALLRAAGELVHTREGDDSTATWEVVVGPTICPECYTVSEARRADLASRVSDGVARAALGGTRSGIDVRAGVHAALEESSRALGHAINIHHIPVCTYEEDALYSYRRDQRTGRQALVASFAPTPSEASQFGNDAALS